MKVYIQFFVFNFVFDNCTTSTVLKINPQKLQEFLSTKSQREPKILLAS